MRKRGTAFRDLLARELKDPEFRKAYEAMDLPVRLAVKIAKLRAARGLTQRALARKLGISQQAMSRIENPSGANYTMAMLQRVATALNRELIVDLR